MVAHNGGQIPLQLDPKWYFYNWEKAIDTVKFIYSTEDFRTDELEKNALPSPWFPESDSTNRGLFNLRKKPVLNGWNCLTYRLVFPIPTFNKNMEDKANKMERYADSMMGNDEKKNLMMYFIDGLYR